MVFKPKRQYEWNPDYKLSIDPNTVGGVLEEIEARDGGVTAVAFLEASRPDGSPTHSVFEWNDSKAAESWRLHQSRTTINALRVTYTNSKGEDVKVSAFIKTSEVNTRTVYENIQDALSNEEKKEIVLARIKNELDSFIIRNQHIEELADLLEEASKKVRKKGAKNGRK